MENAVWNGHVITACEVADAGYEYETRIRLASKNRELFCTDINCRNPVLKYCNGEIRGAYFAHRDNDDCDYALFDKQDKGIMRSLRRALYTYFADRGYHVEMEKKLLEHHYAQLVFYQEDGSKTAVEFGTKNTSASDVVFLEKAYKEKGIHLCWIYVGNANAREEENQTYFLKRHCLNTGGLLVIDHDHIHVSQHSMIEQDYSCDGVDIVQYDNPYIEMGTIEDMSFENHRIVLRDFAEHYESYLAQIDALFWEEVKRQEEREQLEKTELENKQKLKQIQMENYFTKRPKTEDIYRILQNIGNIQGKFWSDQWGSKQVKKYEIKMYVDKAIMNVQKERIELTGSVNGRQEKVYVYVLELESDMVQRPMTGVLYINLDVRKVPEDFILEKCRETFM